MTDDARRAELERARDEARAEGNRLLGSGTAIGVATALSTVLLGATCPLCVVGVPALLGFGVIKRIEARRIAARLAAEVAAPEAAPERITPASDAGVRVASPAERGA